MEKLNVVYCGNIAEVADEIFLSDGFSLSLIVTERGKTTPEMLYFSYLRGIPYVEVATKKELHTAVSGTSGIAAILVCGFGIILPDHLLETIPAYNFHPGKLPDYKGRHPTFFATLGGEPDICISLHQVTPQIDEGGIIATRRIKYRFRETEVDVMNKLPQMVGSMLPELRTHITEHTAVIPHHGGTYYPPVSEADKTFRAGDAPSRILNILRAQARYGGGIFENDHQKFLVSAVSIEPMQASFTEKQGVIWNGQHLLGIKINKQHFIAFTAYKALHA